MKDGEGGSANLVVICIIPCPCPPGKDPRSPLVPYQFNGKPYWFTFNLLRHFLRLVCDCCSVPLSYTPLEPTLEERELLGAASPCGAGLLLRSLSSLCFSGASRLTEYLSLEHSCGVCLRQKISTSYGGPLLLRSNERCNHKKLGHLSAVRLR
jgi:hypothetical protein